MLAFGCELVSFVFVIIGAGILLILSKSVNILYSQGFTLSRSLAGFWFVEYSSWEEGLIVDFATAERHSGRID